jgi:aminopeptidase YwaD
MPTVGFGQKDYAISVLNTLCSDFFAGRGYVNDGVDKAASYIVNELKKNDIGSFPGHSYVQKYHFDVNTFPHQVQVVMGNDTLTAGQDYLIDPNSGKTIGEFIPIEITPQNIQKSLNTVLSGVNLRSILVFDSRTIANNDSLQNFRQLALEANRMMPVVWLTNQKLMYAVGRRQNKHAYVTIMGDAYKSPTSIQLNVNPLFVKQFENKNVIGFIPGKKKKKYIVLTGHYDHLGMMGKAIFPGANDNASGVAMLLSLAKHFVKTKPKYGLVFIFFSGEEAGLEGSKYFVKHPFFNLQQVRFLLNIDIMGSASKGITAVNGTVHKKHFKLLKKINEKGRYLPTIKPRGLTQNSDHYFFSQLGVPSFFVYAMGDCKNYHDINDKAENTSLDNFDATLNLFIDFINKL